MPCIVVILAILAYREVVRRATVSACLPPIVRNFRDIFPGNDRNIAKSLRESILVVHPAAGLAAAMFRCL